MRPTRHPKWGLGLGLAVAWALSLLVASYQLQDWQGRLVRVLVQLQVSDLVSERALTAGQGVRIDWYRDRALALLESMGELHEPSLWTLVMPGSWRVFDDLEARATQRIGHAFNEIVIETIRREIEKRAALLAGVSLDPYTGALDVSPGCKGPALPEGQAATQDVAQMPEFEAMARFLVEAERMERAVASLRAVLQHPRGDAAALQRVVRYSLNADMPARASRSLARIRPQPDAADPYGQGLEQRLAQALRCGARVGMEALQARLTAHTPLLASEQAVRDATAHEALFLPGHESLLAQVERITLLGPALASELALQTKRRQVQRSDPHHFEHLTPQNVNCLWPCTARPAAPRVRWEHAGARATPASTAD